MCYGGQVGSATQALPYNKYGMNFPYSSLANQYNQSTAALPFNQQYSGGNQFGRWNWTGNNYFGLAPSSWGGLFGYQPPAPVPGSWQPPWGGNGAGFGSNQGAGANNLTPTGLDGGQSPAPAVGKIGTPPMQTPMPPTTPQTPPMSGDAFYNQGNQPNATGPVNVGSLAPADIQFLQSMMRQSGSAGQIMQNLLSGSPESIRGALNTGPGGNDYSPLIGYNPASYQGPLQQYFKPNQFQIDTSLPFDQIATAMRNAGPAWQYTGPR